MARKKPQSDRFRTRHAPSGPAEFGQADALMRQRRWREARDVLLPLLRRHPNNVEALSSLVNAAYELKDMHTYQMACERLVQLVPDDPDLALGLAGAYMVNLHPALALRAFRSFLERWPGHPRAAEARRTSDELERGVRANMSAQGVTGPDTLEVAALHEEAQVLLEQDDPARACATAEALLRLHPDFVPALNNLSQIYYLDGQVARAIATARRVLEIEPQNFHALANLIHFLLLANQSDEARHHAERLKTVESDRIDLWVKTAEALTYLGDDEGVLETYARAERAGSLRPPLVDPLFLHLVAVAALRLGREDEARRHWKRALEWGPGLDLAQDNLAELRKPSHERHAPWPFPLPTWMPARWVRELAAVGGRAVGSGDNQAVTRAMRRYLRDRPEMVAMVPLLLDRGDPLGRELALRLATTAETPELVAALRDFALSQRGPDAMRVQAAQVAVQHGLLPSGALRLWQRGEWRDLMLLGFEIGGETLRLHRLPVQALADQAMAALRAHDPDRAVAQLQRALELEPDAPDLLNNLAAAYEQRGHRDEAVALLRRIRERHPDYLFARTGLAQIAMEQGQLEEARALIEPLLRRHRLHASEFSALCNAFVALYVAEGNKDAARSWLAMWREAAPDDSASSFWERRLGRPGWPLGRKR